MEITGWDSVIFTTSDPRRIAVELFNALKGRWPQFLILLPEPDLGDLSPGSFYSSDQLPDEKSEFYVVRDTAMSTHADEHGYDPMVDGDGPFMLMYGPSELINYKLEGVTHPPNPPNAIQAPDPYPARLCSPALREITLVTPGDVEVHEFSHWLYSQLCDACMSCQP